MAAHWIKKLDVDVSCELQRILDEEEFFVKPEKPIDFKVEGRRACPCCAPSRETKDPTNTSELREHVPFEPEEDVKDGEEDLTS